MDSRLLTGTLEMLVLDVLSRGESYGYAIAQRVLARSDGSIEIKEGSLYPALHRLEKQGLLQSRWAETEDGRRRKYYGVTDDGAAVLKRKRSDWTDFAAGIQGVLEASRHALA